MATCSRRCPAGGAESIFCAPAPGRESLFKAAPRDLRFFASEFETWCNVAMTLNLPSAARQNGGGAIRVHGQRVHARALSASSESESALAAHIWSHFLRKTGVHFSGKCSSLAAGAGCTACPSCFQGKLRDNVDAAPQTQAQRGGEQCSGRSRWGSCWRS
jgi:hypothetical protein